MNVRYILTLLLLLSPAAAHAQGIIVPDCRRCPQPVPLPGALPIESVQIDTRIEGQVATTHITQTFRNPTDVVLEGTYLFPIPDEASVSEFVLWDGDRRLVGEVRPREEARRIYDGIVRRRRDPGLLEYAGRNLFQASIFPIPAQGTKKLELTYSQVLRAENGVVGYRYPLGTGRNLAPIGSVAGRVEIAAGSGLGAVYSPSHEVDVVRRGTRGARISFESRRGAEPRDFQLFYTPSDRDVGLSLLTYREPGKPGYFLLLLSPREGATEREYAAKDVVYVLDTSGSMAEEGKMEKARRALLFGIRSLRPVDRFNVVAFAGDTRLMETGLISADARGVRRGTEFVEGLRATGGTNINAALLTGLQQFPREGRERPRMLVFLTDGLPTVEETRPERIVQNAREALPPGVRVFTFGVGYDVNTALLDRLAAEARGTADYIEPREDLEVRVSNFFAKVNSPVLANLELDLGAVQTEQVYPRELPDLFRGTQVALVGRYRNPQELRDVAVRLTGTASPRGEVLHYRGLRFPLRAEEHDFLPRLWATRRVGWLMEQIRTHGENRELRDEVVDLGTRYGIVTPYTSYLALEPGAAAAGRPEGGRNGRAVNLEDFSGRGREGGRVRGTQTMTPPPPPPSAPAAAPPVVTGQAAVQASKQAREQQDAVRVDANAAAGVRRVGAKTFYLRDGVWTDSEWKAEARLPETVLVFGSNEYFARVQREPELARYLALGERVVVVFGGRVYRVRAATQ
ncbi:hypothetical protein BH24GEM2_BH24GEM2_06550 [soil metagenome]|jgi:Ca-activated chloride channel family protein|nr:VIT and VWA domain-containing protein [Gemmatimonadota bacterium]